MEALTPNSRCQTLLHNRVEATAHQVPTTRRTQVPDPRTPLHRHSHRGRSRHRSRIRRHRRVGEPASGMPQLPRHQERTRRQERPMTPASTPYPAYRLPDGPRQKFGLYGFPAFLWCTFMPPCSSMSITRSNCGRPAQMAIFITVNRLSSLDGRQFIQRVAVATATWSPKRSLGDRNGNHGGRRWVGRWVCYRHRARGTHRGHVGSRGVGRLHSCGSTRANGVREEARSIDGCPGR